MVVQCGVSQWALLLATSHRRSRPVVGPHPTIQGPPVPCPQAADVPAPTNHHRPNRFLCPMRLVVKAVSPLPTSCCPCRPHSHVPSVAGLALPARSHDPSSWHLLLLSPHSQSAMDRTIPADPLSHALFASHGPDLLQVIPAAGQPDLLQVVPAAWKPDLLQEVHAAWKPDLLQDVHAAWKPDLLQDVHAAWKPDLLQEAHAALKPDLLQEVHVAQKPDHLPEVHVPCSGADHLVELLDASSPTGDSVEATFPFPSPASTCPFPFPTTGSELPWPS